MERVKGIEPSSLGWEPRALPLSYTRPVLGEPHRRRTFSRRGIVHPAPGVGQLRAPRRATTRRKSARLRVGQSWQAPSEPITGSTFAFSGILCRLRPRQTLRAASFRDRHERPLKRSCVQPGCAPASIRGGRVSLLLRFREVRGPFPLDEQLRSARASADHRR